MNKKYYLVFLLLATCQCLSAQPGQIKIVAADSLLTVAPAVKKQLYPFIGSSKKTGAAHLLLTGGDEKAADNISRWMAARLQKNIYRVNLSSVVSKYIGETEKNLDALFTKAEQMNVILLLDEADALFGKRTDVKDAHDRYSNVEAAYLLQRIQTYNGTVIITCILDNCITKATKSGLIKIELQ